jgi:hypothetical protein
MKYFIDLEFIERGREYPIDLISIGICCEDGREYYAINYDCDWSNASNWVRENVLASLPPMPLPGFDKRVWAQGWRNLGTIADEVARFCGCSVNHRFKTVELGKKIRSSDIEEWERKLLPGSPTPEFWGEWCSYDWVVFAQLFGTMMDLPQGFPMRCRDIIQLSEDELGIPSDRLPASLETDGNHNALLGARTVKMRYEWLEQFRRKHASASVGESKAFQAFLASREELSDAYRRLAEQ